MTKVLDERKREYDEKSEIWFTDPYVNTDSCLMRNLMLWLRTQLEGEITLSNVLKYLENNVYAFPTSCAKNYIFSLFCGINIRDIPDSENGVDITLVVKDAPVEGMCYIELYTGVCLSSYAGQHTTAYDIIVGSDINMCGGRLGLYGKHFICTMLDSYERYTNNCNALDEGLRVLETILDNVPDNDLLAMLLSDGTYSDDLRAHFIDSYYVWFYMSSDEIDREGLMDSSYRCEEFTASGESGIFDYLVIELCKKASEIDIVYSYDVAKINTYDRHTYLAVGAANRILCRRNLESFARSAYVTLYDKLAVALELFNKEK